MYIQGCIQECMYIYHVQLYIRIIQCIQVHSIGICIHTEHIQGTSYRSMCLRCTSGCHIQVIQGQSWVHLRVSHYMYICTDHIDCISQSLYRAQMVITALLGVCIGDHSINILFIFFITRYMHVVNGVDDSQRHSL